MLNPGKYLQYQDFGNEQRTLRGTTYTCAYRYRDLHLVNINFNADEDGNTVTSYNSMIHGFHFLYKIPRTIFFRDRLQLEVDTIDLYLYPDSIDDFTDEDIIARLQSSVFCWSPKLTVALRNHWEAARTTQGKRAYLAWLNSFQPTCQWQYDKYYGGFVQKKLRIRQWTDDQGMITSFYWPFVESIQRFADRCLARQARMTQWTSGTPQTLLSHNSRATDVFPFIRSDKDKSDMFYGLELEYEGFNYDHHGSLLDVLSQYAITKRDGSLSNGVEICTAPAHFDVHKERLAKFFAFKPNTTLQARENTGLHIHISRAPLSFLQLGKIFHLMNNEANTDLLEMIAGRSTNHYCQETRARYHKSFPFTHGSGPDRYRRVNLTNTSTVEFRMFSTPETYENAMSKLEFCKSVIDYSTPGEVSLQNSEQGDVYLEYMYKHRNQYPNLWKYILTAGV